MKHLIGKEVTKKVPFMNDEVEVRELTVGQAREIEAMTKKINKLPEEKRDHLAVLRSIVRIAVVGAADLSDAELDSFPLAELSSLSQAIMGTGVAEGND